MKQEFLIALGSNLGSAEGGPAATLAAALAALTAAGLTPVRVSRFFATPCFPAGAGPDYVNACVAIHSRGDAAEILSGLHEIERHFGRARVQRWGSRTLDLDLLAAGDRVLPDPETHAAWRDLPPDAQSRQAPGELILPHPRIQDRAFVLVPLLDIAPGWTHPLLRQNVAQLVAALPAAMRAEPRALTQTRT